MKEKETDDIIDSTLDVVSSSMGNFDNTLGKIPIYQAGHNLGDVLSRLINTLVETLPLERGNAHRQQAED